MIDGPKNVLKRHRESRSHVCNTTSQKNKEKVKDPKIFLEKLKRKAELDEAVKRFKLAVSAWISNHDIPLSAADSLLPVLKAHVPDSTITLQARVGRTKAIGLIRNVIGLAGKKELVNLLKKTKFSIIVDESTDRTVTKFLVILVRYFSQKLQKPTEDYFSMPVVSDAIAEGLKTLIIQEITKAGIPIINIIAIASDNASVISGPIGVSPCCFDKKFFGYHFLDAFAILLH